MHHQTEHLNCNVSLVSVPLHFVTLFEPTDGKMQSIPSLSGSSELIVAATLEGGDGEASWQHSQLFRQSLKQSDESSFEMLIHLEDA